MSRPGDAVAPASDPPRLAHDQRLASGWASPPAVAVLAALVQGAVGLVQHALAQLADSDPVSSTRNARRLWSPT